MGFFEKSDREIMERITDFCTGCRACEQLCPKKAISFVPDKEGFLVPQINQNKCVDCGICRKRCPQNYFIKKNTPQHVVAARYKDDKTLYMCASGGAYAAMARTILDKGGIVFGVVYDKEWNAVFSMAESEEQLIPILSSKYVQADTRDSYTEVKKQLLTGRRVLYCGTGCQIGGLRSFLGKDFDNLFTIDLICHGVTSPLLFRKYIDWLSKKHGYPITEFDFRDKRGGWGLGYKYRCNGKYIYRSSSLDPYYFHFLRGNAYRECCYKCNYCTEERIGDITIGDFWGIEKEHPNFFSTKGVSVILANTSKGFSLLNNAKDAFFICESSFERVAIHNYNLLQPTKKNKEIRDRFYYEINQRRFEDLEFIKSFKPSLGARVKALIPCRIKIVLRQILHK